MKREKIEGSVMDSRTMMRGELGDDFDVSARFQNFCLTPTNPMQPPISRWYNPDKRCDVMVGSSTVSSEQFQELQELSLKVGEQQTSGVDEGGYLAILSPEHLQNDRKILNEVQQDGGKRKKHCGGDNKESEAPSFSSPSSIIPSGLRQVTHKNEAIPPPSSVSPQITAQTQAFPRFCLKFPSLPSPLACEPNPSDQLIVLTKEANRSSVDQVFPLQKRTGPYPIASASLLNSCGHLNINVVPLPLRPQLEFLHLQPTDQRLGQHHRTTPSPPIRERAEPFSIFADPQFPSDSRSFLHQTRLRRPTTVFLPPAAPPDLEPEAEEKKLKPSPHQQGRRPSSPEIGQTRNGCRCSHCRQGREEGRRSLQTPLFRGCFHGGAWIHAPPVTVVREQHLLLETEGAYCADDDSSLLFPFCLPSVLTGVFAEMKAMAGTIICVCWTIIQSMNKIVGKRRGPRLDQISCKFSAPLLNRDDEETKHDLVDNVWRFCLSTRLTGAYPKPVLLRSSWHRFVEQKGLAPEDRVVFFMQSDDEANDMIRRYTVRAQRKVMILMGQDVWVDVEDLPLYDL
ncbi:hypothetical protein NC651_007697 [Populus alba x Populus x berolinensis]|nr:hypothetical protein NC651_007697 [Populus alba x Populus x berolinensis]